MVAVQKLVNSEQVVDYFLARFLRTKAEDSDRTRLIEFLSNEMGTDQVSEAQSYIEEPLRLLLHLIMSLPEYQLG